jgi:putative transposase
MIAIACSDPQASERPISHWSGREIREEASQRRIIEKISERSVQRFLKRSRLEALNGIN